MGVIKSAAAAVAGWLRRALTIKRDTPVTHSGFGFIKRRGLAYSRCKSPPV